MKKISMEDLKGVRFGLLYRKMALKDKSVEGLSDLEVKLLTSNMIINLNDINEEFSMIPIRDIFLKEDSSQILWLYRSLQVNGESYLHSISPATKAISVIVRGGLNVYKRIGWDIHVLYAYQLVCDNFPMNKPTFVEGVQNDFSKMKSIENEFSSECRFILRIATFLHDIGVVDGVKDHEKKGVKWVEARVDELNLSDDFLANNGIRLSLDDIKDILRFIVGNHQIINQIGSEISDAYAAKRVLSTADTLSGYAKVFFDEHIADIMYLLSAADLMAVDDTLLTEQKAIETCDAFTFFREVMRNGLIERDGIKYGIQRFRSLLKDSLKDAFYDEVFYNLVASMGFNPDEMAMDLYLIPQMNYAMTYVKPQHDYSVGLKMFCLIFSYMKRHSLDPSSTSLKFDPDIDYISAGEYLKFTSVEEALTDKRIKLMYDPSENNLSIEFEV